MVYINFSGKEIATLTFLEVTYFIIIGDLLFIISLSNKPPHLFKVSIIVFYIKKKLYLIFHNP